LEYAGGEFDGDEPAEVVRAMGETKKVVQAGGHRNLNKHQVSIR